MPCILRTCRKGVTRSRRTIFARAVHEKLPDPEIIIRTGGESRLSNFLIWQSAYSELFFTDTLWPDFGKRELVSILRRYAGIERRFGGVK